MTMRRIPLLGALAFLAACQSPTPTAPTALGAGAHEDGGLVLGSGNRTDSTSTGQQSAQEAGGLVLGSGN